MNLPNFVAAQESLKTSQRPSLQMQDTFLKLLLGAQRRQPSRHQAANPRISPSYRHAGKNAKVAKSTPHSTPANVNEKPRPRRRRCVLQRLLPPLPCMAHRPQCPFLLFPSVNFSSAAGAARRDGGELQLHCGLECVLQVRERSNAIFDKLGDGFHLTFPHYLK